MSEFLINGEALRGNNPKKKGSISNCFERKTTIDGDVCSQPHRGEEWDGLLDNINDTHPRCLSQLRFMGNIYNILGPIQSTRCKFSVECKATSAPKYLRRAIVGDKPI